MSKKRGAATSQTGSVETEQTQGDAPAAASRASTRVGSAAKLQRRNRDLSILNSIAQALHREIDLHQAMNVVLAQVADLFQLRTGWVFLVHEETGDTYLAAEHNLPPALKQNPRRMMGTCYCLDTYRDGDLGGAANVNIIRCTRLDKLMDGTDGLRFHASIPLYGQDIGEQAEKAEKVSGSVDDLSERRKIGVLNVASPEWRELSTNDLRLLHTVGDLLSIAIERAQLFEQRAAFGMVEERNRLAREIHDTLAQRLSAITLQLETMDALLEGENLSDATLDKIRAVAQKTLTLSRHGLDEARRSVLDLRAAPLEERNLAEALFALAEERRTRRGPAIIFTLEGDSRPLPPHTEVSLYRMAQEGLNNAIRHAGATEVAITLTTLLNAVQLTVDDNGRGFDVDQIPAEHFGLTGINERARLLGGTLTIESCPGAGTKIVATVPIEK